MRLLLSKESRKILFNYLSEKYDSNNIFELSKKLGISKGSLSEWKYNNERYIPNRLIPLEILNELKILDKQPDNWGRVKGGKRTYEVLINKYGIEEIRRRQSAGGMRTKLKFLDTFQIDIKDLLFLEFYGILLGDGCLSRYKYKNKVFYTIVLSGHRKLDKNFFLYIKNNIKKLFNRKAYIREYPLQNSILMSFSHKLLLNAMSEQLIFPVGKKVDLRINNQIYNLGFEYVKYVIRGIFDTDGSFYLDKTPVGHPYPCISIQMKAPILIKQLNDILIKQGFKVTYREYKNMITLKGNKQLSKWMEEIGSSNKKHLDRVNDYKKQNAPVVQLDRTTAS